MSTLHWVNLFLEAVHILAVIFGLWIAGTLLPALISLINIKTSRDYFSTPSGRILLWIAAGTLCTFPLMDILTWIGDIFQMVIPTAELFTTALGAVPLWIYAAFQFTLITLIYGVIVSYSTTHLPQSQAFSQFQRLFIVLTVASLVYRGIFNSISQVFNLLGPLANTQQNYGIPGFFAELLVGVLLWIGILCVLYQILFKAARGHQ